MLRLNRGRGCVNWQSLAVFAIVVKLTVVFGIVLRVAVVPQLDDRGEADGARNVRTGDRPTDPCIVTDDLEAGDGHVNVGAVAELIVPLTHDLSVVQFDRHQRLVRIGARGSQDDVRAAERDVVRDAREGREPQSRNRPANSARIVECREAEVVDEVAELVFVMELISLLKWAG